MTISVKRVMVGVVLTFCTILLGGPCSPIATQSTPCGADQTYQVICD